MWNVRNATALVSLLALVLLLCLPGLLPPFFTQAYGSTKHPCASPQPAPVTGTPIVPPIVAGVVVINEVLTNPATQWNCSNTGKPAQPLDTWLELYNPGRQPLDLYAVHAAIDNGPFSNPYMLPIGTAIPASGYLVLFPYTSLPTLVNPPALFRLTFTGIAVDTIAVPTLAPDQSYARTTDGGQTWAVSTSPTIGSTNTPPVRTPTARPSRTYTPHSSTKSDSGVSHTTAPRPRAVAYGVQPDWRALRFPTTPTPPASARGQQQTSVPPTQPNPPTDIPRRALLTLLVAALAASLYWCWRVFRPPPTPSIEATDGKTDRLDALKT